MRAVLRGGIGLSIGVFGSALVGAFSIAASPVLLIPMAGAAYIGWRSVSDGNHASREIEILRQIAEVAKELASEGGRTE